MIPVLALLGALIAFATPAVAQPDLLVESACGPKLLIQVPLPDRSYNGPTVLEGDVYDAAVRVTVTVDGAAVPVTLARFNASTGFWRWTTPKVKKGAHVAVITAMSAAGSTTVTSRFRVVARP